MHYLNWDICGLHFILCYHIGGIILFNKYTLRNLTRKDNMFPTTPMGVKIGKNILFSPSPENKKKYNVFGNFLYVNIYMSHFAYACKTRYPLNLVLKSWEYLWFY